MAEHTKSWPELAVSLYDRLTGRNAEIRYHFEDMNIKVPSGTGDGAEHAEWKLDGTLSITTQEHNGQTSPNS